MRKKSLPKLEFLVLLEDLTGIDISSLIRTQITVEQIPVAPIGSEHVFANEPAQPYVPMASQGLFDALEARISRIEEFLKLPKT